MNSVLGFGPPVATYYILDMFGRIKENAYNEIRGHFLSRAQNQLAWADLRVRIDVFAQDKVDVPVTQLFAKVLAEFTGVCCVQQLRLTMNDSDLLVWVLVSQLAGEF